MFGMFKHVETRIHHSKAGSVKYDILVTRLVFLWFTVWTNETFL